MKITAVDNKLDLFQIENFYPLDLLEKFSYSDHMSMPWKKEAMQTQYPRRRLIVPNGSIYKDMNKHVNSVLETIADITKINYMCADTGFWLDESGFSMAPHVDNEVVFASMQIFLNINRLDLGTTFYNMDKSVRFKPEYRLNNGYIMINNNSQLHGMSIPVPENSYRICSYTWFYPKT